MSQPTLLLEEQQEILNQTVPSTQIDSQKQNKLLISTLVEFYHKIRNPSSAQITQAQSSFVECQKKIIKVLEFRKDLQKSYQFSELNETHLEEIQKVQRNYSNYQQTITSLLKIIQQKQNYIVQLELELHSFRLKQAQFKKRESADLRQFCRMQENFKQIKLTFADFVKQLQKPQNTFQKPQALDENRRVRDFLRNKDILVESKVKFMKIREQMIECAEIQNQKYTQSLKEAVDLYEDVLKKKLGEQENRNKNGRVKDQIAMKEEEYNRLCRTQLTLYEKQLSKMQELCSLAKVQIEKMELQLTQKDKTIFQLESKLNQSKRIQQQHHQGFKQLNVIIDELKFELQERTLQVESYKTSVEKQENGLKTICDANQKYLRQVNEKEKQLLELKKENSDQNNQLLILRSQLNSLREQSITNKMDLQKTKTSMKKSDSKLASQTTRLSKQMENLTTSLKLAQKENQKNIKQIGVLKEKITLKQSQLKQLTHHSSSYQKHAAKLQLENRQLKQQVGSVKRQILQKNQEIYKLAQEVQHLWEALSEIKQKSEQKDQVDGNEWELEHGEENLAKIKLVLQEEIERQWLRSREEFQKIMGDICEMVKSGRQEERGDVVMKLQNI